MLLGFQRRFAPFVEDGSKTHTIRGKRKRRPKVGETAHCYVDPRQKTMRLLRRSPITRVQDILIDGDGTPKGTGIWIEGVPLDETERDLFAWRDGFRFPMVNEKEGLGYGGCFAMMLEFWMNERKADERGVAVFPFDGDLVHWNPEVKLER